VNGLRFFISLSNYDLNFVFDWEDIDNPQKGAFELDKVHEEEKLTSTA
jgi:hypothetical protein